MTKYIVVTGGVLSGLGKGLAAASIGFLLSEDYKIVPIKCDGYLNVDPGTMNPVEHGEVYVLDDGTEVDMDFGHYERFLDVTCKGEWNLTMGKIFERIRKKERKGDYLGHTVEMIPDVTDLIMKWWREIARKERADVVILEIGGTVGDMENELYLESVRRLKNRVGEENVFFVHLTHVPVLTCSGEIKSKPSQHSVIAYRERGLIPDMVIGRCAKKLTKKVRRKIAEECDIDISHVVTGIDVGNIFEIPLEYVEEGVDVAISDFLGLKKRSSLNKYRKLIESMNESENKIRVAICGKYTGIEDSYSSVIRALQLSAAEKDIQCKIELVETTDIEEGEMEVSEVLEGFDGVVVPGGFGTRGVEGKIEVIEYCRENDLPYLGLCYGLQLAVVEFARNVCGLEGAHTTEVDSDTKYPVVMILPEKENLENIGGTLRLGSYPAELRGWSLVRKLYDGKKNVKERHRHRYEVNPEYHEILEDNGLALTGMSPDGRLVEFIENPECSFFVATQAHPEFISPAPLFLGFVEACGRG